MYVKVFADILQSTVWSEDSDTRIVWLTLLLLAEEDGLVRATAPGIAHLARVPLDRTCAAIERFESPDEFSRTPENEGRRLERVDGGYVILNYARYRALKTRAEQREQTRKRVQAFRERKRLEKAVADGNAPVTDVTPGNATQTQSTESPSGDSSPEDDGVPFAEIMETWNSRGDWARITGWSPERKTKLRTRWKSRAFREKWRASLERAARNTWRSEHADFDAWIKNDNNWRKYLECKDDRGRDEHSAAQRRFEG